MMNRLPFAALALAMMGVTADTHAQCASAECSIELANLEAAILPVPEPASAPEQDASEHSSQDTNASQTTPTHFKPWLFLQLRQFGATGINRGSLYTTELNFGAGIPLGTPHLALLVGASMVGGAYRDVTDRTVGGYVGMGMFLDLRLRLNVDGPVRMFVVGGGKINLGGPLRHGPDVDVESEECPSLTNVEASFGLGAEFSWRRQGLFSLSVRGVRRRSISELSFAANGTNPPITSTRGAWGVSATIEIGAYFN